MQLTEQQTKALARLQSDATPDWQTFLQLMRDRRESARSDLEVATGVEGIARLQGRAQAYAELLQDIEQARENALRFA